jgi:DNA ligase 1
VKLFTRLFLDLDTTNKTAEKLAAMQRYFEQAPPADAAWGLFFLSGLRLKRVLKTSIVRDALLRATHLPEWMIGECYETVGDLSETISLLLPDAGAGGLDESLHVVVNNRIIPLTTMEDPRAVQSLLKAWSLMDRPQRFVFNKLIRGNFRVGVQKALVIRALSQAAGLDPAILTHRFSGNYTPDADSFTNLIRADSADDAARPYPFCLASALLRPLTDLGDPANWQLEYKWDGIRAQIVRRDRLDGGLAIWSRGEELITQQFPEIASAARALPPGTVLDGEILAWQNAPSGPGRALTFNTLQTRINRKDIQASLFDPTTVIYLAFDLLEHNAIDIRSQPLSHRRALLDQLIAPGSTGTLRTSPAFIFRTWTRVQAMRNAARDSHNSEGIMLKHLASPYHTGRIAGGTAETPGPDAGWWKWKVNPYSVDAVLIYAQQGSGKRAGLFTDYTFGVWDPNPEAGTLTPFAKAYSGLTNDEIRRVDAFIRANTTDRAGPVRMVRPHLVFEISFEAIRESTRHRSGIAVRFPRITRWREDKSPDQADTIATVRQLLAADQARDIRTGPPPTQQS